MAERLSIKDGSEDSRIRPISSYNLTSDDTTPDSLPTPVIIADGSRASAKEREADALERDRKMKEADMEFVRQYTQKGASK
jgi:hypothetical protein